jgi:superfamily II DNA or RNA helicase
LSLKYLDLKQDYRSESDNLITDFYLPCLGRSIMYDRAVGYFSSASIEAVARGLTALIRMGGKMRLIASPNLSEEDVRAIATGLEQKEKIVTISILEQIEKIVQLEKEFDRLSHDSLATLAWLLSQGLLEIKLAVPKNLNQRGIYHEKLGIFRDAEDNAVAFTGSANETASGLIDNFECIDVFCSWKPEERERTQRKENHFQRLWSNQTDKVEVLTFPEAAAKSLLKLTPKYPPTIESQLNSKQKIFAVAEAGSSYQANPIDNTIDSWLKSEIVLRPLQQEALSKFEAANRQGILAMATGAGKTITALACADSIEELDLIVIGVPTKDLVEQWREEMEKKTNFPPPIIASGNAMDWMENLRRKLNLIRHQRISAKRQPAIFIGTYKGLSQTKVANLIDDMGGLPKNSLLIADEVHGAGSTQHRNILRDDFNYRLGLSATPIRQFDEEGTEIILDYFKGIIYEFNLKDAIEAGILCEYEYRVYVTTLTEEENETYKQITSKISRLYHSKQDKVEEKIKRLRQERARIIKAAESKINILDRILEENRLERGMIYCADDKQATAVSEKLAKSCNNYRVARYTSKDKNRQGILQQFSRGHLDAIVAIKCLDEGIDIPSTDLAIILASDTTERQFIQRRGRILRAAPKKTIAKLIDVLVVPPLEDERASLIQSEINRVKNFAESARNRESLIVRVGNELKIYGSTYSDLI